MGAISNLDDAGGRPIWRALSSPCHVQVRRAAVVLVGLVLAVVVVTAWQMSRPGVYKGWSVGDWLVNFAGGWTRRGLGGHLVLLLASSVGVSPPLVVFGVKLMAYGVSHGVIAWRLLKLPRLRIAHVLVVLSPAVLLFPVLDRAGGGRKEILLFCRGSLVLGARSPGRTGAVLLSACLGVLVLLHEGLFFFMPLFAVLAYSRASSGRSLLGSVGGLLVLPAIAFGTAATFRSPQHTEAMCRAMDPVHFASWCRTGIMATIDGGVAANLAANLRVLRWYSVPSLVLALGLAGAPWALVLRVEGWQGVGLDAPRARRFVRALVLAALAQAPLFVLTKDWGRWLAIDFTLLALWYLAVRCRHAGPPGAAASGRDLAWQIGVLIIYLLSLTLWRISHCCAVGFAPSWWLVG